jgi:hypothetical protein
MANDFESLAMTAAGSLVSAMATDAWAAVKQRFAAAVGHERVMDQEQAILVGRAAPQREGAAAEQVELWARRFLDDLTEHPEWAPALRALLADDGAPAAALPEAPSVVQQATGAVINQVSAGRDANVTNTFDRRKFFVVPVALFSAFTKFARAHRLVVVMAVLGLGAGGAVGGGLLARAHGAAPAPAATRPRPGATVMVRVAQDPTLIQVADLGPGWSAGVTGTVPEQWGGPLCDSFSGSEFAQGSNPIAVSYDKTLTYAASEPGSTVIEKWQLGEWAWHDSSASADFAAIAADPGCFTDGPGSGSTKVARLYAGADSPLVVYSQDASGWSADYTVSGHTADRAFSLRLDILLSTGSASQATDLAPQPRDLPATLLLPANMAQLTAFYQRALAKQAPS